MEEEGAPVLMLLLCAVLGCAVLQLCRGLCRRRVVDGKIEKFMVAYLPYHGNARCAQEQILHK